MKLELSYQTQNLPAPFAFAAYFSIQWSDAMAQVDFNLTYLDREGLSEEEIAAEGFSDEDDFTWSGELGSNWIPVWESLLSQPFQKQPLDDFYLHVSSEARTGYPAIESDMIIQELLQAVFEQSKKEAPLEVWFYNKEKKQSIKWKFASHQVYLDQREIDWHKAHDVMELLYAQELEELKPSKKPLEKSISFDSYTWIKLDKESFWQMLSQLQATVN